MRPCDLDRLYSVSRPAIHPDGWGVVSALRPDFAADAYVGQLWRVPLLGGTPRRLTRGFRDSAPKISPDGQLIGFLRAAPGAAPQLAILPAGGGEPLVVTDRKLGVTDFTFTEDSARAVFISAAPEEGRYGMLDGVGQAAEDPRRITTLNFQGDGRGYTIDQRKQVFVVDLPDPFGEPPTSPVGRAAKNTDEVPRLLPEARQLTHGDFDHAQPVVAGEAVIVVSARHEGRDRDLRGDLYRIDLSDGVATLLTDPAATGTNLFCNSPVVVGDDVYFLGGDLGPDGLGFVGTNSSVYRMPVAGGAAIRLTEPENLDFSALAVGVDGDGVLAILAERGVGVPVRIGWPGGDIERLVVPEGTSVTALAGVKDMVVASVVTQRSPSEVARLAHPSREPEVLTDFAAGLHEVAPPRVAQEIISTSPDGQKVQGWALLPDGPGPHPVLLNIHGGPFAAYGPNFFDEFQVFAAAGYAVLFCNPRGSGGYGQEFGRAIQGDFGNLDRADVLAFLDHALATLPELDGSRLGVMGGSYGGYLTAWLIAHEHRFAAAIVERGFLDPRSFTGHSDIGWFFMPAYNTADPLKQDAQSPLLLAGQVKTPTLVLHSEQDLRCPLGQALRYYTELKLAGVETELLVFPGETHELSRSGTPWHRRQRFEAIVDWWRRHLPL
ncbi:MAG: S9 family peptidase [Promicromonosporaceae bacterium]|nr:S9 family peptidase [Promicromonosporaceae bacterium]